MNLKTSSQFSQVPLNVEILINHEEATPAAELALSQVQEIVQSKDNSSLKNVDTVPVQLASNRKKKYDRSKQEEMKNKKDLGTSYITKRGKGYSVEEKSMGNDCKCRNKCFDKVNLDDRTGIFTKFWNLGDYNAQNSHLLNCLRFCNVARRRNQTNSKRHQSVVYTINEIKVCKKAFLSIHGMQNNRGRLENIIKKIGNGLNNVVDNRGKHHNHPKKYFTDEIATVIEFVNRLPKYKNDDSDSEYMSMEYNILTMHTRYLDTCQELNQNFVSLDKFRRIFNEKFNIKFKHVCNKCLEFAKKIDSANSNGDTIKAKLLRYDQENHLGDNSVLRKSIARAKEFGYVYSITFDIQQPLPTPKLNSGPCFFKSKLWTYNLGVHSFSNIESSDFFLWNETEGKRGSDETASCLYKFFKNLKSDTLYAASGNSSLTKNLTMVMFWIYLLLSNRFNYIVHNFIELAHASLPISKDFSMIERHVEKSHPFVYTTDQWVDVSKASNKYFNATRMSRENFLAFSDLKQHVSLPVNYSDGSVFSLADVVSIKLSINHPFSIFTRCSFSEEYKMASLLREEQSVSDVFKLFIEPRRKYGSMLSVNSAKLKDISDCIEWIPAIHQPFYLDILTKPTEETTDAVEILN